ncbi:hypothetical protein BO78DRAFT_184689 [Aspergillus sclerotiicarbonarius CBS 121057]|uniref:Uncharacterized protein n=1 Tax=Aspergillus sclerotiicarbonarius (strain CBS 121057 / IBT 28362) TaxID=1448318 RepID=A0A319EKT0_ASPSB|nr:hypothetical protein BO78DRAFT_184689 [Aspergillus sclerotiicarbonarius CBS 121057]
MAAAAEKEEGEGEGEGEGKKVEEGAKKRLEEKKEGVKKLSDKNKKHPRWWRAYHRQVRITPGGTRAAVPSDLLMGRWPGQWWGGSVEASILSGDEARSRLSRV